MLAGVAIHFHLSAHLVDVGAGLAHSLLELEVEVEHRHRERWALTSIQLVLTEVPVVVIMDLHPCLQIHLRHLIPNDLRDSPVVHRELRVVALCSYNPFKHKCLVRELVSTDPFLCEHPRLDRRDGQFENTGFVDVSFVLDSAAVEYLEEGCVASYKWVIREWILRELDLDLDVKEVYS